MCDEYQAELEKAGNLETIKKRLENEKKARCQLVKEKVSGLLKYDWYRMLLKMNISKK